MKLFKRVEEWLKVILVALSFIMLLPLVIYVFYFLFIHVDEFHVFAGCLAIYTMLHLNKSL